MSKQYAHLHAMLKTSVTFQNDWPKTVGGVALTSQLLTKGQTDERTNRQTDGSRHAYIATNAGATKTKKNALGLLNDHFPMKNKVIAILIAQPVTSHFKHLL